MYYIQCTKFRIISHSIQSTSGVCMYIVPHSQIWSSIVPIPVYQRGRACFTPAFDWHPSLSSKQLILIGKCCPSATGCMDVYGGVCVCV